MKISKPFLVFLFLIILCFGGLFLLNRPMTPNETNNRVFEIKSGQGALSVSRRLAEEKIARSRSGFLVYAFLSGNILKFKTGYYFLSPAMSIWQIVEKLGNGEIAEIKAIFPEGFTIKQIEERLNKNFILTGKEIGLKDTGLEEFKKDYWFLKDIPSSISLEGFLFPDSYIFSFDDNGQTITQKMLDNFSRRTSQELSGQEENVLEIVTMASLLEKEVKTPEDKKIVSGILWKRIEAGMPL